MTPHALKRLSQLAAAVFPAAALIVAGGMAASALGQPAASPEQSSSDAVDAQLHGAKLARAYCGACHGADGNSADPHYPKLAGQEETYLVSQLHAFKSGARKSELMSGPAAAISDAQIGELARFYSQQTVRPDTIQNARLADLGARIFNSPGPGFPPCAACHGRPGASGPMGPMMGGGGMMGHMGMMGHAPAMGNTASAPNLNGQHAAYTIGQLEAFASGTRVGSVMGPIAAALSAQDRKAIAEYLSGLR